MIITTVLASPKPSPLQEWGSSDEEDRSHRDRWGAEPATDRWPAADPHSERWTASPAPEDQPPAAGLSLLQSAVACHENSAAHQSGTAHGMNSSASMLYLVGHHTRDDGKTRARHEDLTAHGITEAHNFSMCMCRQHPR